MSENKVDLEKECDRKRKEARLNSKNDKNKKNKKPPIKTILFISVVFIIGAFFIFNQPSSKQSDNDDNVSKEYVQGLRYNASNNYKKAIKHFEKVSFKTLSDKDKYIVLMTYVKNGEPQKALKLDKTFDEEIVNYYDEHHALEQLKNIKTKSNIIRFEQAILNDNYKNVIKLSDSKRLKINERKAKAISNAYYQLGDINKAIDYTSLSVYDDINIWANHESDKSASPNNVIPVQPEPNNHYGLAAFLFVLLLLIGLIAFYLFKKEMLILILPEKKEKKIKKDTVIDLSEEIIEEPTDLIANQDVDNEIENKREKEDELHDTENEDELNENELETTNRKGYEEDDITDGDIMEEEKEREGNVDDLNKGTKNEQTNKDEKQRKIEMKLEQKRLKKEDKALKKREKKEEKQRQKELKSQNDIPEEDKKYSYHFDDEGV